MKFEELTVGRIVHYKPEGDPCRAAIVVDREGDQVILFLFHGIVGHSWTSTAVIGPDCPFWHDPRGCK